MQLLYLSRADVEAVELSMREVIDALEEMFREKGAGRGRDAPEAGGSHPKPDAFLHAMPAFVPALRSAGIKWVAGLSRRTASAACRTSAAS